MPPVFGGAPTCPRCLKSVYFNEQSLGPGGVAYHKLCLKCISCGKLLEPRLLLDHDGEAYCKPCHSKAFGAKGYGAGGALVGEYAPRSPSNASPVRNAGPPAKVPFDEDEWLANPRAAAPPKPMTATKPIARAVLPPPVSPPAPTAATEKKEQPVAAPSLPKTEEPVSSPPAPAPPSTVDPSPAPPPTLPLRSTASLEDDIDAFVMPTITARPAPPPLAPKPAPPALPPKPSRPSFSSAPSPSAPAPSLRTVPFPAAFAATTAASPPKVAVSPSKDLCPRCRTIVYFAEEVRALGSKWHKRCLRCTSCSAALAPNALNERDGEPFCKKCYGEKWGLRGAGVMSRPNLY
ncbi:hypothetical protein JCM8097_006824 [Rhodosporidiobolus ruineniae]